MSAGGGSGGQVLTAAEGVIGLSIFKDFVVTFDYDRMMITLVEPERFTPEGAWHEIPITLGPTQVPQITCEVELQPGVRVPVNVVVDTGAVHVLSLTLGTSDSIALPPGARECVVGYSNWGRLTGSLGRAPALHIGDLTLRDVLVTFFQKGAPGVPPCGEHGILGNEALARFTTTFDYAHQRMFLAPNRSVDEPFETGMGGIGFEKAAGGALRVLHVVADSPASEAGLQEGDLLIAVNGRPASELATEEFRRLLRTEGAEVRLRVEHEGRERAVTLRLRRLV